MMDWRIMGSGVAWRGARSITAKSDAEPRANSGALLHFKTPAEYHRRMPTCVGGRRAFGKGPSSTELLRLLIPTSLLPRGEGKIAVSGNE